MPKPPSLTFGSAEPALRRFFIYMLQGFSLNTFLKNYKTFNSPLGRLPRAYLYHNFRFFQQ